MDMKAQLKQITRKPYFYFLLFLILIASAPSVFSLKNPYSIDVYRRLELPSTEYLFGTDDLGRCIFSRIIYGAGISIITALSILLLSLFCGAVFGIIAGYFGGILDEIIMRLTDIFMTIPSFVIALVLAKSFGPGMGNVIIILSITMWTGYARMIRGLVLSIKNEYYIQTAKIIGLRNSYILVKHILPGILPPILVMATLGMGRNILMSSSLSFLGLGFIEPSPDWGAMLNKGMTYISTAPHIAIFPGIFISLTVLSFNMLGDALGQPKQGKFSFYGLGSSK